MAEQAASTVAQRRAQLRTVADAYFRALAQKDFAAIPYDDNVVLRAPLAPGGAIILWWGKRRYGPFGGHR